MARHPLNPDLLVNQYLPHVRPSSLCSACILTKTSYTVGNIVGSLFTGPICDHFGRRAGMATGSVLIMAAAAILTAAQNDSYLLGMLALVFAQISRLTNGLIGGRFLLGFGVSIGTSSAPTYALELAPPQWRARVVGYYNTCPHMFSILLPADVLQSSTPARSSPLASPTLLPNLTPSSPSASRSAYSLSLPYLSSSAPS